MENLLKENLPITEIGSREELAYFLINELHVGRFLPNILLKKMKKELGL
jgi:hypothetical protein